MRMRLTKMINNLVMMYQQQDDETSTVTSALVDSAFDPAYFGFENLDLHNNNDEKTPF